MKPEHNGIYMAAGGRPAGHGGGVHPYIFNTDGPPPILGRGDLNGACFQESLGDTFAVPWGLQASGLRVQVHKLRHPTSDLGFQILARAPSLVSASSGP